MGRYYIISRVPFENVIYEILYCCINVDIDLTCLIELSPTCIVYSFNLANYYGFRELD